MLASKTGARVAVLARIHNVTDKVTHLLEGLAGGRNYDFYVTPNVSRGSLEFGDYAYVPYSTAHYNALGFDSCSEYFLLHCSDILFSVIREQIPDYDHYILVEYDVHFPRPARDFMDRVAQALTSGQHRDVDLSGTQLGPRDPWWMWSANVRRYYPEVLGVFYPFVIMSNRAIGELLKLRREERRATGLTDATQTDDVNNLMYCEAFTASALKASGYRLLDLNDMFPGCYKWELFTVGLPKLLGEPMTDDPAIEIVHPVYGQRDFLERRLSRAQAEGVLPEFLTELERVAPYLPVPLHHEYRRRAGKLLVA
jgi:hypothetical protein